MIVLSCVIFVLAILWKLEIYKTIIIVLIVFRRSIMFTFDVTSIMKKEP